MRVCVALVLALASVACSKGSSQGSASASSSASGPKPAAAPASGFPPPTSPMPADARTGGLGARWSMLAPGSGALPGPEDQISVLVTAWKRDGSPGSNPPGAQPFTFSVLSLPEELREGVLALRPGAKVRYWLPASALGRWKPPAWESADLTLDLELVGISKAARSERELDGKAPAGHAPKPDLSPPEDAKKSKLGYPYLKLIVGEGGVEPRPDARIKLRFSAWRTQGLVITSVVSDQPAALALAEVPSPILDVVSRMVKGDVIRIWLPPSAGKGLIPGEGGDKLIVDLGLAEIE